MKRKLYLVLSILVIIALLTSAQICNLGQTQTGEETKGQVTEGNGQGKVVKKDSTDEGKDSSSDATADTSSGDSDKKDEPKPEDNKSGDKNKPPVISGIYLDGLDPIDYFFFTGDTYTVRAEAIDPEGGSLTFSWSGDGTISGNDINPMTWTAPSSEGIYKLTVEVTDDKGNTAAFTSDIYVDPKTAAGDPPKDTATIFKLNVGLPGLPDYRNLEQFGPLKTNTVYRFILEVNDPSGIIDEYAFDISAGKTYSGASGDMVDWETPDTPGNYTITVTIFDINRNILDSKQFSVTIQSQP